MNGWKMRLEAARDALTRSRYAFIAVTIISAGFLVISFNEVFSWERYASKRDLISVTKDLKQLKWTPDLVDQVKKEDELLRDEAGKEWMRNKTMSNSLLGISIDVDDAPILGSLSLLILTMWFFYSMRRENHLIASLLIDATATKDRKLKELIFHGVSSYLVFITVFKDDYPIDSLDQT